MRERERERERERHDQLDTMIWSLGNLIREIMVKMPKHIFTFIQKGKKVCTLRNGDQLIFFHFPYNIVVCTETK